MASAAALLDRPQPTTAAPRAPVALAPSPKGRTLLTDLEWSVVALARFDRLSSLDPPGPVATWLARLFGPARPAVLADARLEALRHMAVLAWHQGYSVPPGRLRAFLDAGFTLDQYELLQSRIGAERAKTRGRRR